MKQVYPKVLHVLSPQLLRKRLFGKDVQVRLRVRVFAVVVGGSSVQYITPAGRNVPWSLVCGDEEEERKSASVRQKFVGNTSSAKIRGST